MIIITIIFFLFAIFCFLFGLLQQNLMTNPNTIVSRRKIVPEMVYWFVYGLTILLGQFLHWSNKTYYKLSFILATVFCILAILSIVYR